MHMLGSPTHPLLNPTFDTDAKSAPNARARLVRAVRARVSAIRDVVDGQRFRRGYTSTETFSSRTASSMISNTVDSQVSLHQWTPLTWVYRFCLTATARLSHEPLPFLQRYAN